MPGRHRRVGREDARRAHRLDRLAVGQARVLHQLADPLEPEEPGVALVGVEHLRIDPEGVEGAHAADAEEDLLAQAVLGLAAVEPVGDRPQVGGVLLHVGVEQVERHPPDLGPPHPATSGAPARSTSTVIPSHGVSAMACGSRSG